VYCLSTKLSTGNLCGSAKALERSRGDLSGLTTALGHTPPLRETEIAESFLSLERARHASWQSSLG
jgi:hypothetical protein